MEKFVVGDDVVLGISDAPQQGSLTETKLSDDRVVSHRFFGHLYHLVEAPGIENSTGRNSDPYPVLDVVPSLLGADGCPVEERDRLGNNGSIQQPYYVVYIAIGF